MWCLERKKFKQVVDYINNKNFQENRQFIQSIPMLSNLDSTILTLITSHLIKEIYDAGNYIIKQGESADCIYIVKEGTVYVTKGDEVIRTLAKGEFFGLYAVLSETTRTMNVIAKTHCACYSISIGTLISILGVNFKEVLYVNFIKMAMKSSKYFNRINSYLIDSAFSIFQVKQFSKNQVVMPKGKNITKKIIIIIEGDLVRIHQGERFVYSERGKVMFEREIIKSRPNNDNGINKDDYYLDFDLVADPDCLLLEADLDQFTEMLGGSIQEISEKSSLLESISKVPLFRNFTQSKLNSFVNSVTIENFNKGEKIITEGEEGSKFYIVKQGKIDITVKNEYIRTLNEGEFFGERSLFVKEPRSATAIAADTLVTLYVLSKDIFKNLEDNLREFILRRLFLQDNTITLSNLDYVGVLGKGNFGSVFLVSSRKNNCLYALKVVSKNQIDQEQLHGNLDMERKILLQIDHPFIMKMVKSLKDENNIYFLTEYIRGKELWDVIREIGLLNKNQTQFYGCSLMIAVDYLHSRRFIYRDIKPENIIVTEQVKFNLISRVLLN